MCQNNSPARFLLFVFSILTAATAASNITFECSAGWDLIGTHCYNFVNIKMDFDDARNVCHKYGAALLVIRDEVEAKSVSSVAQSRFSSDSYWIYNGRVGQETKNSSLSSSFCEGMWQPNEPRVTNEEVAVASNMQSRWALTWVWMNLPFVCRTPACPSGSFRCNDGSCLNRKWKCDNVFDCWDQSDENDCKGSSTYYQINSGTFDTTNLIYDGRYQWIIEGQPGQVLRIEFETLTIKDHMDSVRVYTGGPSIMTSDLIKEVKQSQSGKFTIFSKNHFLIVTLQSDTSIFRATVKASWRSDNEVSWSQVETVNVIDTYQFISTPYYNSSLTPKSFKKEWLLKAPEGEIITLEVLNNTFDKNAGSDIYIVTDVGFELKELNSNKAVYISSKNSMSVIIKTNSGKRFFRARIRTGCDFETTLSLATFSLMDLPVNLNCSWKVHNELGTDFRVRIDKTFFGDLHDFLQLFNGTDMNLNMVIDTLNHSIVGVKVYSSISNGVSFKYFSDIIHPDIEVQGHISADCPNIQKGKANVTYSGSCDAGNVCTAQITCEEGFTFKQEEYIKNRTLHGVCNEGGMWNWGLSSYSRIPECQIVYCGFPPPIPNGFVSKVGNITYNGQTEYQCISGFQINTLSSVRCQADGNWSTLPSCIANKCSGVFVVANGTSTTIGDLSQGTVVNFSCNPGYGLRGPQQIVCLSNRTWSHAHPECKELTCPLPLIKHGHYESRSSSLPKFGDTVSLICDFGYQINRTNSQNDTLITCSVNRKLSVDSDVCIDVDECSNRKLNNCSATEECLNKEGSYYCSCKSGYNGTDCRDVDECALDICHQNCTNLPGSYHCSCQEGYILYTKNGTNSFHIPAGEDGLKSGDVFQINNTCVPVICEHEPEVPAHGHHLLVKSHYFYNESVEIICDFGYKIEGSSFAVCQSNGNWTYSKIPSCKKLTCHQPVRGEHEAARIPATGDIEPKASLIIACNLHDGSGKTINKTLFCAPSPNDYGTFILQGDNPICPDVDCGRQWNISGASQNNVTNTTYGSSFEFGCDNSRGFTLKGLSVLGNNTVICQSNGRWGYANLTCEGAKCKDPGTKGGTIQTVKTSYEIGQTVQYNCTRPGFTPVPNDTLVCEYKNGKPTWSGVPPICEDIESPVIICPKVEPFDLYSMLVYQDPTVVDNSGISCFLLDQGSPSGKSLVSKNMTVKYNATDNRNDNFCEFTVTVKDPTEPTIECHSSVYIDLAGNPSQLLNLSEVLLISHSGDGTIMFDPEGPINLTVGSVVPVRANITKDNGLVKECAFLVNAMSTTDLPTTLTPPEHGKIKDCVGNGSNMNCTVVCDDGYLFQSAINLTSYSDSKGTWSSQPCLKLSDAVFDFEVTLQYTFNGSKVIPSPDYDQPLCLGRHYSLLSQLVKNMSACGFSDFQAKNMRRTKEIDSHIDEISFTLQLLISEGNETALADCAAEMLNQSETLFGPTNPRTNNMSCFSPWMVLSAGYAIVAKYFSCEITSKLLNENGKRYCLPCGPGMFFSNKICQECQDGHYQDEESQTSCKQCPGGVHRSYVPRTKKSHCFELCPAGFISTSGYLVDNCTSCPEDHFSSNQSRSCQLCPKNGSTLGVSGAKSETECSEPCPQGQYSLTGYLPCSPCPQNFYSDITGARHCVECLSNSFTLGSGSISIRDCLNRNSLCTANFCNPAGTMKNCEIIDHRPVCICKPGYFGDSCDKSCDVCSSNPCYNDGICMAVGGLNFICTCKSDTTCTFNRNQKLQFTSNNTIVQISAADKNKCQELCTNNTNCLGYLVEGGDTCYQHNKIILEVYNNNHESYIKNCTIRQLFEGPLCELDLVNDCNDNVCTSSDFCMDLVGGTRCQCPRGGNYDSKCSKPDDLCSGIDCNLHGRCISYGSVHSVCECDPGYTGDRCETDVDECALNRNGCLYNGTCQNGNNTYSCSCLNGFSGTHCEVIADVCHHNDCFINYGGICNSYSQNLTARCTCPEHYTPDLQKPGVCAEINYCSSSPCVHGRCRGVFGGFHCDCISGFEGSLCQHKIDGCVNHTCRNGASCNNSVNGFICDCPVGFRGDLCEENIDDCPGKCVEKNLDQNCTDLVSDFYCPCKPQFAGKNCSENVDECTVLEPCLHGGKCSDFFGGYNCMCEKGWTGDNCELEKNCCSPDPCQNNGICHNLLDQFYCQCQNGTSGEKCDLVDNMCKKFNGSLCTANGKCELNGETVKCKCFEDYSGIACELQKNHCADNPCNGSICTLSSLSYVCDYGKVENCSAETCDEAKVMCKNCPVNTECRDYLDQDGNLNHACVCPANATFTGNKCQALDKNYDLEFLESFAEKDTFVMSERGFYLDKNTSLSVSLWVAAARELKNNTFVLALRSSRMKDYFLLIFNTKVQIRTYQNKPEDIALADWTTHSLDESFIWHFLSIAWSTNGSLNIVLDYHVLPTKVISSVLPSEEFVFVHLGQSFYGYISQVSVWKSVLSTSDSFEIYGNKLAVPQINNLILGWTHYSFDNSVQKRKNSTAAASVSVCNIPNTIAKMNLNSIECKNQPFIDKSPAKFNYCNESIVVTTDYSTHQVNSNDVIYNSGERPKFPESQLFSHGAHDIVVSAIDEDGNTGVCMTRAYITPNKCSDTEPSQGYTETCLTNPHDRKVTCPPGMMPSVPTPNFVRCGKLQTYNLDNMYEQPDRIVCGLRKPRSTTVNVFLSYTLQVACGSNIIAAFNKFMVSQIMTLNKEWPGLCNDQKCNNVNVTGNCTGGSVNIHLQINNSSESLNSSIQLTLKPQELMKIRVAEKVLFDASSTGGAKLEDKSQVDAIPSCDKGYGLSGKYCVQCGRGSYFDEGETKCKLCDMNKYSDNIGSTACLDCPSDLVTLQKGSSSVNDCKEKCHYGQMLNATTDKCVPCPTNFYQDKEGKNYCIPCPPSYWTQNNGSKIQADCIAICIAGTYFNVTDQECISCPQNFYQDEILQKTCKPCPVNMSTNLDGAVSLDNCTFVCSLGYEVNAANVCIPCPRGTYKDESLKFEKCQNCTANMTTDYEGSIDLAACNVAKCSRGFRVSDDNTTCVKCPIGTYQDKDIPLSATVCEPCPQNTSTLTEASTSTRDCQVICEPGFGFSQGKCEPCQRGTWNNGNSTLQFLECQVCPVNFTTDILVKANNIANCSIRECLKGYRVSADNTTCVQCPIGTYQDIDIPFSSTVCKPCPQNTSTQTEASTSMNDCKVACGSGFGFSQGKCEPCQRGTWNNGNSTLQLLECQICPVNFTTDVLVKANDIANCSIPNCLRGYRVSADNTTCVKCPIGTYQHMNIPFSTTVCEPCPQSTSTQSEASTSMSDCQLACEPGFGFSQGKCEPCQRGTWNNGNSILQFLECQTCPVNFTTDVFEKATEITNCSIRFCGPGTYSDNRTQDCSPCDKGYYQEYSLQTMCNKCPNKTSTSETGSISSNDCIIYCPPGEEDNRGRCVSCPDDQFKEKADFSRCLNCTGDFTSTQSNRSLCTEMFCDVGHELKNGTCTDCQYGYYKPSRGLILCIQCPVNSTTAQTASTSLQNCSVTKCGKGYYWELNSSVCKPCPVGEYQSSDSYLKVLRCTPCPLGKSTLTEGAPDKYYCIQNCSEGEEYQMTSKNCSACPVGMYRPPGIRVPPTCLYCLAGFTTLGTGKSECIPHADAIQPNVTVDLSVVATITVQECSNPELVSDVIKDIVLQLIQNQNNRYSGLCTGDCRSDVVIKLVDLCAHSSRKKRQTGNEASVIVMLEKVDFILKRKSDNAPRSSMAVLLESFYDTHSVENSLKVYQLTIDSIKELECGQHCVINKIGYPQFCVAGHFTGVNQCEPCPKGSYSTSPVSEKCISCPVGQTTDADSSQSITSCNGICSTDSSYCGINGVCKKNNAGIDYCQCDSDYTGYACQTYVEDKMQLVVGISVGIGGFMLVVLIIFGYCAYRKRVNRKSTNTSQASESELTAQRFPEFNQALVWTNPTKSSGGGINLHSNDPTNYMKSESWLHQGAREPNLERRSHSSIANSSSGWD